MQIGTVEADNLNETAAAAIDLEPDNEFKEEEKETKDIGVANKEIDNQTSTSWTHRWNRSRRCS